ncbi:MAG TPA: division plane positioning ATPase MipZ, partial [Polyangiales bacterium]|nr:division plane positioning ATPase MipZ [Polyangiales bacterium]
RMSTVHLVGGEKGGVGKSVVARLLAQSFIDRGLRFAALDADQSHGSLARAYADFSQRIDLTRLDSADQILDRALGADRRVVVDLPAQSHRALRRWIDATDVLSYAREMDVRIVLWHVTDGGFDSVAHLEQLVDDFGDSVEYVIVKNEGRSKDFSQLDASPVYARLQALRARFVSLPELDPVIMYKVDRFGTSFWAAVNAEGAGAFTTLERRRAKLWLERAKTALDATDVRATAGQSQAVDAREVAQNGFVSDQTVN